MEGGISFIAFFFYLNRNELYIKDLSWLFLGECLISESLRPNVNIPPHCCKWLNLRVNMHPIIS